VRNIRKINRKSAVLAGMALLAVFSACGTGDTENTGDTAGSESMEISVVGSTTVQPLAELLSEAYAAVDPNVLVTVSGGGSSVGVKSAGDQSADIGMVSRDVKSDELEECPELVTHTIARDGIAVVASLDVEVNDISIEQAAAIFSGEITNWSELGGTPGVITVVSREEGSGTRTAFEELVMGEALISANAILQPSNGAVRTTVVSTPGSVAYISFGYIDESTKPLSVNGALPTSQNVNAGSYPVVRPLNMVTYGEPEGAVADWLDFIMGEDGQAIVVAEGYLPAAR
jgi:phosphate transport system substrate-binding protein